MTVGQRIAQKRKEQSFSQEVLGEKLGVSRQSVYKWESDAAVPEIDKLIAMSRLFGVTVGWLLGVEEEVRQENAAGEKNVDVPSAEEKRSPVDDGELSDAQLKMVQEIVERYIAAQPKLPRRRWLWLVSACAVIALVWALVDLSGELDRLNSRYHNLSDAVNHVSSTVNGQINGIADRVEKILQSQNSLLAEYSVEIAGADLETNELFLKAKATPKTYTAGMTAAFVVDTGNGAVEYPAVENMGHRFVADITCELTDTTIVSVVFARGGTRETQILSTQSDLYSGSFPAAEIRFDVLMLHEVDEDGTLRFLENEYVFIADLEYAVAMNSVIPAAEIAEVKVGFFKNRELVTWLKCHEGIPERYVGFEDWEGLFYQMPTDPIRVGEEDLVTVAVLVIDEYGRERLYPEIPYAVNGDNELTWAHDRIQEEEDWYDTSVWRY